jgi:predicted SprT family Zn-dependent metalloprotease
MKLTTLTSQNLAHLYDMACKLPPFNKFKMPSSKKVTFRVIKNPEIYGCFDEVEMEIQISSHACGHFTTIFQTLLHEMTHLALYIKKDPKFDLHEESFLKIKHIYSEVYNLDPKAI